ncbi:MAG TPA: hypothetical protein VH113_13205, partial [Gemmatimonadales bacterium]|nr:hypothetical protein [Gemmatimonadales bacterium]
MQSSRALGALPVAFALSLLGARAHSLGAQTRYQVRTAGTWIRDSAGGKRLAQLTKGTLVDGGPAQGLWLPVTIEGWIWGKSVGPGGGAQGEYDLVVTNPAGENLRDRAKGAVEAQLPHGFALQRV